VAEKPRDAVVKFDTYRNVQRHRAVILAIVRHLVESRPRNSLSQLVLSINRSFITLSTVCLTFIQFHTTVRKYFAIIALSAICLSLRVLRGLSLMQFLAFEYVHMTYVVQATMYVMYVLLFMCQAAFNKSNE